MLNYCEESCFDNPTAETVLVNAFFYLSDNNVGYIQNTTAQGR